MDLLNSNAAELSQEIQEMTAS